MQERMPVLREEKKRSRSSRKLLAFLVLLFVTLLAVLFFRSPISKIERVEVTGNAVLTAEEIGQASGVRAGDNFFGFSAGSVRKRVLSLPAVEDATVRKKFPGVLEIAVSEYPHVAFEIDPSGGKKMVLASGLAVPVRDPSVVVDKPVLTGWRDDDPWKIKLCETLRGIPDKMLAEISEITPSPTKTYEDKIKMYTRSKFEVYTTVTYLPDKIQYLDEMIGQMAEKQVDSGVFELLEVNTHSSFELYYGSRPGDAASGDADGGTENDAADTQKKTNGSE